MVVQWYVNNIAFRAFNFKKHVLVVLAIGPRAFSSRSAGRNETFVSLVSGLCSSSFMHRQGNWMHAIISAIKPLSLRKALKRWCNVWNKCPKSTHAFQRREVKPDRTMISAIFHSIQADSLLSICPRHHSDLLLQVLAVSMYSPCWLWIRSLTKQIDPLVKLQPYCRSYIRKGKTSRHFFQQCALQTLARSSPRLVYFYCWLRLCCYSCLNQFIYG